MTRGATIAIGSIFTECNHFGGRPTDLAAFERQQLCRGAELLEIAEGTIGGALNTLRAGGARLAPLLAASTCPGGPLTSECYRRLKTELVDSLRAAMPVDAVLLALHGAASAEDAGDLEGDLLSEVRKVVGPERPVIATLDLHAHVTEAMVSVADALVAWETYPHRDAYTTGVRAALLLLDVLVGKVRPCMALAKVPVLVGGVNGHTEGAGPFADVMRFAKSHEGRDRVVSTSVFLVHPYLDLPEMGGGAIVIADGDMDRAASLAREIAWRYWQRREDLNPPVYSPAEAIALGQRMEEGPVLLVETADCCGGGAAGDSVATLRALLASRFEGTALVPVVDPVAASACHRLGVGREITLELGHRIDPRWGSPLKVTGEVMKLSAGQFRYSGGIWEGQQGDMGPSAVLKVGQVLVLIATHATYDWADEQFRSLELDARQAKFVVVKNPMNHRLGYQGLYRAAYILDTPGPTPAVANHLPYRRLARPYFPVDCDIPGLEPAVYRRGPS